MKRSISFGFFSCLRDELIYFNYISIDNISLALEGGGMKEMGHD